MLDALLVITQPYSVPYLGVAQTTTHPLRRTMDQTDMGDVVDAPVPDQADIDANDPDKLGGCQLLGPTALVVQAISGFSATVATPDPR